MYTDNLYDNFFKNIMSKTKHLTIISGYASSYFLEKVMVEYQNCQINLYIGMTHQGVTQNDHDKFKQLQSVNDKINIFYQIKGDPTHQKIYHFSNGKKNKNYVGSANFSENGFVNYNEILVETNEDMTAVFSHQHKNSLRCDHEDIERYVTIVDSIEEFINLNEEALIEKYIRAKNLNVKENNDIYEINTNPEYDNNSLSVTLNSKKKYKLKILLDESSNLNWHKNRINAPFNNEIAYLEEIPTRSFRDFFAANSTINVYTKEGEKFQAELFGKFNKKLKLKNSDFYLYIKNKLNIDGYEPINHKYLEDAKLYYIVFTKMNENEYLMELEEN